MISISSEKVQVKSLGHSKLPMFYILKGEVKELAKGGIMNPIS